jgi:hypothetical protein
LSSSLLKNVNLKVGKIKKSKLRLLCLHGFGCCDEILSIQTKRLRELTQASLVNEVVEYDFISAPDKAEWDPESYEVLDDVIC